MTSTVPDASLVLTITPEKEYTSISVREVPDAPFTTIKVKEFTKKFSSFTGDSGEVNKPLLWWHETTEITGIDITGKKFAIIVLSKTISSEGSSISACFEWLQEKDEKKGK
jgi:hypothetical protein